MSILFRLLFLLAITLGAERAAAETIAPAQRAIDLGRRGLDAYAAGAWDDAFRDFEAADALAHSPVFMLYMARCRRNVGELLEARELFRRVATEELPSGAPEPWGLAVTSARTELQKVETRVASVWLQAEPGAQFRQILLDGRPMPVTAEGLEIEVDPGAHELQVVGPTGASYAQALSVAEGARRVQVLIRSPAVPQQPSAPAQAIGQQSQPVSQSRVQRRQPVQPPARSTQLPRTLGYASLAAGGASMVVGVVTGLVALNMAGDVSDRCTPDGQCRAADEGKANTALRWADVSTVSFVAGGMLAALGATVLLVTPTTQGGAAATVVGRF